MKKYNAVILGGGRSPVDKKLPKGNTPFNGISLGSIVYEAVKGGYDFNRQALVMNLDERINLRSQDEFVKPTFSKGAWLSGYEGIKAISDGSSNYVLVAGDLPFLKAKTIKSFMELVEQNQDSDIIIPLVPRELNEEKFPNRKRTYQKFEEGEYLGGNLGHISKSVIENTWFKELLEKVVNTYNKHGWLKKDRYKFMFEGIKHAGLSSFFRIHHKKFPAFFNSPIFLRLFPYFSMKEIEDKASDFFDIQIRLVEFPHPESAFDIDKLKHLELAKELYESEI